ncbi:NAD(P)/FAD-dependent oxidoreductase [Pseudooceanicola sp. CBS1P-1]|uniref:Pyridine nucleotide-disulfide oxidoreductase domain-containing protein 2 n=1 Tax=Pseudooceanicola albus TaxID=2692189 RepID=A0A6L7G939_9RHOB|nr:MULTISPECIES: NAD(P)/FAD-dependent oxidoreductase [Pseudooceanicola]MBT9384356.1 NAD(P)/FAD-dependent oxidoreductase [Pseudooceanicola endophyticus]MXN19906.1 FAD-dependent oxidoreductase [Pseudooceanicola albus]
MSERIVVIGSGINGLVAAADLAANGKHVLVLERGPTPGGAVRTEALTLPGFRHDVAAMNLSAFAASDFLKRHGAVMARNGLDLVRVDRPFAQALEPGDHVGISTSLDETLASFESRADRTAWREMLSDYPDRAGLLRQLFTAPVSAPALAKLGLASWRRLGRRGTQDLAKFLFSSPRAWVEERFEDPRLRTTLAAAGLNMDFAPDISGGAALPYLEGMGGQKDGMVIGRGGADTVTRALVAMIEDHGSEVRCNAEVSAIRHSHGRVSAVVVNGEEIEAGHVLANLAPRHLARLTGGTGNPRYDRGLARYAHAPGTMMIHLALDGAVPWQAGALKRFASVTIGRSMDDSALAYQQARAGLLPERPVVVVGQPSVFDPTRAPEGKQVLWVQVRMVPALVKGDAAKQITGTDWSEIADAYADRVLDLIEEQAPGLRGLILGQKVVSPLDLEAGNPNLVGGDQAGGSAHLNQNFAMRPVPGYASGRTPVKGLHLVGAACWPGAGTGAASGFLTAQRV